MDREGRQIEYKKSIENYKSICKTIVAFSNDIGGTITIGIEDKILKVIGLTESSIEQYLEDMPKAIYDAISPYCVPEVTTQLIDDKPVITIKVHKGERKPYFIKSEGTLKGIYIRVGAHNKRATPETIEDLHREGTRKHWDEEATDITINMLDQLLLKQYYNSSWNEHLLNSDFISTHTPFNPDLIATNAGVLYFHPTPTVKIPSAEILFTEYKGKTTEEVITTQDLTGPLPIIAEQTVALLKPHLIISEKMNSIYREVNEWKIPEIVIREVLLNALVHRKYTIQDAIKIAVFEDRIEVFSPGNFPGPIDLAELGNGISYARNPRLRHLCRKAGLVEKRGMGFRIILDECKKNRNKRPVIIEGPDHIKVTLSFGKTGLDATHLPDDCLKLQHLRDSNLPIQTMEVSKILAVSINTARNRIVSMVKLGILEKRGKGRAVKYYWN